MPMICLFISIFMWKQQGNKYSAKNNRKYSDLQQNTENPQQNYKNTEKIHQNTEIQIHVIKIDSFNKIEIK